jgi:hypothetical protein
MLRAVDFAHLFFLADDDLLAGDVLCADGGVLRPLEPVEEVVRQGSVKVYLNPGDDGRRQDKRVLETAGGVNERVRRGKYYALRRLSVLEVSLKLFQ